MIRYMVAMTASLEGGDRRPAFPDDELHDWTLAVLASLAKPSRDVDRQRREDAAWALALVELSADAVSLDASRASALLVPELWPRASYT